MKYKMVKTINKYKKPFYIEVKVTPFEYKGVEFGRVAKKDQAEHNIMEYVHIYSGSGFNGSKSKDYIKVMEDIENRIKDFWSIVNSQKSVDENIAEYKEEYEKEQSFIPRMQKFEKITGIRTKLDRMLTILTGKRCINIFELEKSLLKPCRTLDGTIARPFKEDGDSISGYITEIYGKETAELLATLI